MPEQHRSTPPQERLRLLSVVEWSRLPLRERVADRLADLRFDADDLLDMCSAEEARQDFAWLERDIRRVYERVNELMYRVTE